MVLLLFCLLFCLQTPYALSSNQPTKKTLTLLRLRLLSLAHTIAQKTQMPPPRDSTGEAGGKPQGLSFLEQIRAKTKLRKVAQSEKEEKLSPWEKQILRRREALREDADDDEPESWDD